MKPTSAQRAFLSGGGALARAPEHRRDQRLRPASHLERACFAAFAAASRIDLGPSESAVSKLYPGDAIAARLLTRAAVSGATTTDSAWAGTISQSVVGDFIASLGAASAGSKLVNSGMRVSLDGVSTVLLPRRTGLAATDVPFIGEATAMPARRFTTATTTLGPGKKMAVVAILSRELAKRSAAEQVVSQVLRDDAAASLDAALFSSAAASTIRPAGLLNVAAHGTVTVTATAGGTTAAMETDLERLAGSVAANGGTSVVFIASPRQANAIAIRKPDLAFDVWPSAALAAGTVICLDPTAFISGFGTEPVIDASREATIHAEDATLLHVGTAGAPATIAAPTINLFQQGQVALRLILDVGFTMSGPALVSVMTGATWGTAV